MTEFLKTYDMQPTELKAADVAKILHCTKAMVYKLCLEYQELTYYKIGTRYRISKDSLRDYILRNRGGRSKKERNSECDSK